MVTDFLSQVSSLCPVHSGLVNVTMLSVELMLMSQIFSVHIFAFFYIFSLSMAQGMAMLLSLSSPDFDPD